MGRDTPPADVQLTRAFVAAALGLVFALWLMRPAACESPNLRTMLPELRAIAGVPSLVI